MLAVVGEVVELRRAGSSIKGLCPFHDEKTPSFTINAASKVYYCHGCQAGGDVISFVRETRGLSFVESLEFLADRAGIEIVREHMSPADRRREKDERSQRGRLLALNVAAQSFFEAQLRGSAGELCRQYITERGLTPETCATFGLGMAPNRGDALVRHLLRNGFDECDIEQVGLGMRPRGGGALYDRFRNRLMYPVYQNRGDIVAFGGRQLGDEKNIAKYMNSPEAELTELDVRYNSALWKFYKKSHCVFGLVQAQRGIRRHQMAVIVEGNIDVMMLHQAGLDCTVCAMGTALTEGQLQSIKRFTDRVALIFDGDAAGRKAAIKSVPPTLAAGLDGVRVNLPDGEDPDSFVRRHGIEALKELIANADDLITGLIDAHVSAWDGSMGGKSSILQQIGPILATIPDPITRDMARDYLGTRLFGSAIEENRGRLDRYLRQVKPAVTQAPKGQAVAKPALNLPPLEHELAQVVLWHPTLLLEVVRVGALSYLTRADLKIALGQIAAHIAQVPDAPGSALADAVQELKDTPLRGALLQILVEAPHVEADVALARLEQNLDQLQIAALQARLQGVLACMRTGRDHASMEQWARESVKIQLAIKDLKRRVAVRRKGEDDRETEEVIHV